MSSYGKERRKAKRLLWHRYTGPMKKRKVAEREEIPSLVRLRDIMHMTVGPGVHSMVAATNRDVHRIKKSLRTARNKMTTRRYILKKQRRAKHACIWLYGKFQCSCR